MRTYEIEIEENEQDLDLHYLLVASKEVEKDWKQSNFLHQNIFEVKIA